MGVFIIVFRAASFLLAPLLGILMEGSRCVSVYVLLHTCEYIFI